MKRSNAGFSMLELVIALTIGAVLTGIAVSSLSGVQGRIAVRGARSSFQSLHARARVQAIELGRTVRLNVDPVGDSVWISTSTETLQTVHFDDEFNVDIQLRTSALLRICMTSRGFADTDCNSYTSTEPIAFRRGDDASFLSVLILGSVVVP